jgi:hypothetical protein
MAIADSRSRRLHVDDPRVRWLVGGAVGWSAAMIPVLLLVPLATQSSSADPGEDRVSILEAGAAAELLPALLVPLVLSLVAWFWGQRSRTAIVLPALLYDLAVVLAILSVGVFFAPAAIMLTIAALARRD